MSLPAIYLAGKIAAGDWRHRVVDGLREECVRLHEQDDHYAWRRLPGAVGGRFDYVGPYFVDCGHGRCYHGPRSHGGGADSSFWCDGASTTQRHRQGRIARACLEAARQADVVLVWLDDPTAHGTLVELGFVLGCMTGRVSDRRVVVARPHAVDRLYDPTGGHGGECTVDDLWFASALPGLEHVRFDDPVSAVRELAIAHPPAFESPAEAAFWVAWQRGGGPELAVQHVVLGGAYRLDFAHLGSQTAIEIDGLAYHGDQAAFRRDRERDRRLTAAGWRVVRFTAKEVFEDAARCAFEVRRMLPSVSGVATAVPAPSIPPPARIVLSGSAGPKRVWVVIPANRSTDERPDLISRAIDLVEQAEAGVDEVAVVVAGSRSPLTRRRIRFGALVQQELRRLGLEQHTTVEDL